MVKLDSASQLVATNFQIETVDLDQRTTLEITSATSIITDTAAEFLTADGVGFAVGDIVRISFLDASNTNNGTARITAVTANSITIADHSGTLTDQATGQPGNIHRIKKTFAFVEANGLNFVDGVSLGAIASKLYDLFDAGGLEKFDPPIQETEPRAKVITFRNGWEPANIATLNAIRDGAIRILDGVTGQVVREYANVESGILLPGPLLGTHPVKYWFREATGIDTFDLTTPLDSVTTDYINQLILIRDVPNAIDRTTEDFQLFLKMAVPGFTIDVRNLNEELGLTNLAPERYRTGLNIALDLKLADVNGNPLTPDTEIATQEPYISFSYTRNTPPLTRNIEGVDYTFTPIINRAGGTKEQIHEWLHWLARQNTDIDSGAGTLLGVYSPAISSFLGEQITFQGYADGTPATENNDTVHVDDTGTARRTAQEASFTIDFRVDPFLDTETADFKVFLAQAYNTDGATVIRDKNDQPMEGTIAGNEAVAYSISFSTFDQQGHTPGNPIPIIITLSSPNRLVPDSSSAEVQNNTTQIFVVNGSASSIVRN